MADQNEHPMEFLAELALGVMPPANAETLQAHIAGCERCQGEYEELRRVAALLPLAAEDVSPPEALKTRVLERVAREPVSLDAVRRAPCRWGWPAAAVAASVAVVAVLAGLMGFALGDGDNGLEADNARYAQIARAAATGDLMRAQGASDQASVAVLHAPGSDSVFAWVQGLPELPRGRAYQAWFSRDGTNLEPGALFTRADGPVWLQTADDLANYALMAFTVEDQDGASAPSQAPFVVIDLRAAAARLR